MAQLISTTSCVDGDDDDGYDSPPVVEDWNAECDEGVAFFDHRRALSTVMDNLLAFVHSYK